MNSARKPSLRVRDRLRPACVGMISAVAWAKKVRQRLSVRSSSRSMRPAASMASATSTARRSRCGPQVAIWRSSSSGAGAPDTCSVRASPASRSSALKSGSTSARPCRSTRPCRASRESSRVTSERPVPTRSAISRWLGARSMRAALSAVPAARAMRKSSPSTRSWTRRAPSSSSRAASSRTDPVSRRSRRSRTVGWLARMARNASGGIEASSDSRTASTSAKWLRPSIAECSPNTSPAGTSRRIKVRPRAAGAARRTTPEITK